MERSEGGPTGEVLPVGEDDVDALQALLEQGTAFAEQVTGYPTGPSGALSTLLQRPEGLREDAKTVLGLRLGGRLVAVADLLVGHPAERTATLGLLLVAPDLRRRGLGRRLHDAVVARVRGRADRIRLGVVDTNAPDAVPFFTRLGSAPEGDALPFRYDRLRSTVRHWMLLL